MSSSAQSPTKKIVSATAAISPDVPPEYVDDMISFLDDLGAGADIPPHYDVTDFYSDIVVGVLKPLKIEPGSVSCLVTVKPSILNFYKTIHGGAVAAIAEAISIACARTVTAEDKYLFLGELSISYLSGAPLNSEVTIEAKVVRKGRNVTVVSAEFRIKNTQKLIYLTRATFYNMPASKL